MLTWEQVVLMFLASVFLGATGYFGSRCFDLFATGSVFEVFFLEQLVLAC